MTCEIFYKGTQTVLSGDREAIAKLTLQDLEKIALATLTGMSIEQFKDEVTQWITAYPVNFVNC